MFRTILSLSSQIKDPEGRAVKFSYYVKLCFFSVFFCFNKHLGFKGQYLILTSHILDTVVTIVSYYAPNKRTIAFLSHLLQVVDIDMTMSCQD